MQMSDSINFFQTLLFRQKDVLESRHPQISHAFTPIKLRNGCTLPFLPIRAFRVFDVFSGEQTGSLYKFLSSGSTQIIRAKHWTGEAALENADKASLKGFLACLKRFNISSNIPFISFVPPKENWQESSLAHMISSFKKNGLKVVYLDPLKKDEVKEFLDTQAEAIVFGTTIHHFQFMFESSLKIETPMFIFDTGGTKGRSRVVKQEELLGGLHQIFTNIKGFFSEYGMCELHSQSYSAHNPHDGLFLGNDGLTPIIIDANLTRECAPGETGFLAFLDAANLDSYAAIITEDLAVSPYENAFKLLGRSPDATVKGCSLNVSENYLHALSPIKQLIKTSVDASESQLWRYVYNNENLEPLDLPKEVWTETSLADLKNTLSGIKIKRPLDVTRLSQNALIVSSSNIPIAWLYPAITLLLRGVSSIHVQLPSLRVNDPLSDLVRKQTLSLIESFKPLFSPCALMVAESSDVPLQPGIYDLIVVFGNDQTIKSFSDAMASSITEVIGLGDIRNSFKSDSSESIVEVGTQWLGRGCLTPLVALTSESFDAKEFSSLWESHFESRYKDLEVDSSFFHKHDIWETEFILKTIKEDAIVYKNKNTCVIDLRAAQKADEVQINIAGSGLMFLATKDHWNLGCYACMPSLETPHMGRLWSEWIR